MRFTDHAFETAHKLGTYQAFADMMRREIRNLDEARSKDDELMRIWAVRNLRSLAEQFEETVERFEKEVDILA